MPSATSRLESLARSTCREKGRQRNRGKGIGGRSVKLVTVVLSDASPAFSVVLHVSVVFSAPAISARPNAKIRRKHHGDTEDHGECLVRPRPHYPTSLPSVPSLGPKGVLDSTGPHRSSARGRTNRQTCWGPDYPGQQANCGTKVASFIYPFWPLAVGFLAAQWATSSAAGMRRVGRAEIFASTAAPTD